MKKIAIYLLGMLALVGCQKNRNFFPQKIEPIDVRIERFDSAFLSLNQPTLLADSQKMVEGVIRLQDQFPDFYPEFAEGVMNVWREDTTGASKVIAEFLSDTLYGYKETNLQVSETFADVSMLEKELSMAFGRVHYLYPDWQLPTVYLFVSGFTTTILGMSNGDVAVSADMYLGSEWPYYNQVAHQYEKITMRKECIPTDIIVWLVNQNISYTYQQSRLLDQMLFSGKKMYLIAQLLPNEKPWEVMGYTEDQWNWCVRNERGIWTLMMDKKDLFKTDHMVLTSYINNGPFTSEVSQDSPGRLGTWVGWRIVESYMQQHPEVSLQQLMEESDAQLMLEESYYKP